MDANSDYSRLNWDTFKAPPSLSGDDRDWNRNQTRLNREYRFHEGLESTDRLPTPPVSYTNLGAYARGEPAPLEVAPRRRAAARDTTTGYEVVVVYDGSVFRRSYSDLFVALEVAAAQYVRYDPQRRVDSMSLRSLLTEGVTVTDGDALSIQLINHTL